MAKEDYRITVNAEDGRAALMVLVHSLEMDDGGPFEVHCRRLLESGQKTLLIDMCGVERVPSTVVAAIVKTHNQAREQEIDLTVCCRKVIAHILRQLLGDDLHILD